MRKLSIVSVVTAAWRAWRRDWLYLTAVAFLIEAPLILLRMAIEASTGVDIATDDHLEIFLVSLPMVLWAIMSHHLMSGMVEGLEAEERQGHHRPTIGHLLRDLPWVRLIVADIIVTAAMAIGSTLVIPGLIIGTYFAIALPLINLERQPVIPTLKRSVQLVHGHFWRVLVIWATALVVTGAVTETLSELIEHAGHSDLIEILAHVVPEVVLLPVTALPAVMMAFELVAIDAERRAQSPSPTSPTSPTSHSTSESRP